MGYLRNDPELDALESQLHGMSQADAFEMAQNWGIKGIYFYHDSLGHLRADLSNDFVIQIPLAGGKYFTVTWEFVVFLSDNYPFLDIGKELWEMTNWYYAHPDKRKTDDTILLHMQKWLDTALNQFERAHGKYK